MSLCACPSTTVVKKILEANSSSYTAGIHGKLCNFSVRRHYTTALNGAGTEGALDI